MGDTLAGLKSKSETRLKIDEDNGSKLKLLAYDPCGREAEAISVKTQRSLQISHAKGDDCDAWLHGAFELTLGY
ncbi:hypothetical protein [Leptolyngbya subtilissima]|uniref:hypothetical protein n=1 Tax=Leptolyngbya subtilissima TaxID=1346803 RepID=UPI003D64EE1A